MRCLSIVILCLGLFSQNAIARFEINYYQEQAEINSKPVQEPAVNKGLMAHGKRFDENIVQLSNPSMDTDTSDHVETEVENVIGKTDSDKKLPSISNNAELNASSLDVKTPSIYCVEAKDSLSRVLERWVDDKNLNVVFAEPLQWASNIIFNNSMELDTDFDVSMKRLISYLNNKKEIQEMGWVFNYSVSNESLEITYEKI